MLKVKRLDHASLKDNARHVLNAIEDPDVLFIHFFATPDRPIEGHTDMDALAGSLPNIAVVIEVAPRGAPHHFELGDGSFMHMVRLERYSDVADVLDAAEKSGKADFSPVPVPFTASLTPSDAAEILLHRQGRVPLTAQTRAQYFALLCKVPEEQVRILNRHPGNQCGDAP